MNPQLIRLMSADFADFCRDESRSLGHADSISFPKDLDEVIKMIKSIPADMPVTVQGARTGIAAGAVPRGGHICNVSDMKKITALRYEEKTGRFFVTVQPGVLLETLNACLSCNMFEMQEWDEPSKAALAQLQRKGRHYFPPDPTETTASLGGMAACNASGAHSFFYGATRNFIERLQVVLSTGETLELDRGQNKALGRTLSLKTQEGRKLTITLPAYTIPIVKNAAGLYAADGMDAVDLFIGSEGILGIVTAITLRLILAPPVRWGLTVFLPDEARAVNLVRLLRGEKISGFPELNPEKPAALEFFNLDALELLRTMKNLHSAFAWLPELPQNFNTAIYVEYHGPNENAVCAQVEKASELLEACGGNEGSTWSATTTGEIEHLRKFRHAVPEAVNMRIDDLRKSNAALTKLGTDMAVPDNALSQVLEMYNADCAATQLETVIFGHIGDNHLHVNILPASQEQYDTGKRHYARWAQKVIALGGTISAEHGVGRLKKALLLEMYGKVGIEQMKAVKKVLDPAMRLNPGVMVA
ncbi:MAG: FAD-binding oxidoreductase [Chitinivibrionales bacterium]|nr:FAD-binding oxidoreductase [Chitinivibrionales bacterium]